ncbi:MAG TPA: hypothetical protein DCM86_04395 [Verrucomicrobiales bacterium]|nr:hypothetical protein [Verrucomicrobiales bacterium]
MSAYAVRRWSRILPLIPLLPLGLVGGELGKETFRIASGETFSVEHPSTWRSEVQLTEGLPINTLRLTNRDASSLLLISVMPGKAAGSLESMDDLEQMLLNGTRSLADSSKEKQVHPLSFKSQYAYGVYATLTDARFAGTAETPPRGSYRYSATFILNCASQAVTATFLTNEEIVESTDLAVMILRTLHKEEPAAPRTSSAAVAPPAQGLLPVQPVQAREGSKP